MTNVSNDKISKANLEVMLPDTRGVTISRWGRGNLKIGPNVLTYSKTAGASCPGATEWCRKDCYAMRINGPVVMVHERNRSEGADVPPIPSGATLVRIHVAGDFDSVAYIRNWIYRVRENPGVKFWAYTRSWRIPELLMELDVLQQLPNMQLFASMDESTPECPPKDWRVAWIEGDERMESARPPHGWKRRNGTQFGITCPEETGKKPNCEECRYCFEGRSGDVVFLKH